MDAKPVALWGELIGSTKSWEEEEEEEEEEEGDHKPQNLLNFKIYF